MKPAVIPPAILYPSRAEFSHLNENVLPRGRHLAAECHRCKLTLSLTQAGRVYYSCLLESSQACRERRHWGVYWPVYDLSIPMLAAGLCIGSDHGPQYFQEQVGQLAEDIFQFQFNLISGLVIDFQHIIRSIRKVLKTEIAMLYSLFPNRLCCQIPKAPFHMTWTEVATYQSLLVRLLDISD